MGWEYSEKTKQLFMDAVHGKPGTHLGEVENPDGVGEHGSIACGDALRFTFKVTRNEEEPTRDIITEARYLTFGCTSAIAASEALCCIIEDRRVTPIEALKITNEDIVEFLDGLPQQKIHCSVMGAEALQVAVIDWARRRGVSLAGLGIETPGEHDDEGRVVCKCFGLTEPYIKRKVKELNLHSLDEIAGAIKAGGACGGCQYSSGGLQDILNEVWGEEKPHTDNHDSSAGQATKTVLETNDSFVPIESLLPMASGELTARENSLSLPISKPENNDGASVAFPTRPVSPYLRAKKIEQVIEDIIRPALRCDGGDIELVDIKENIVYVELLGACANCAGAIQTLKFFVENQLKKNIDPALRVVQV